MSACGPFAGQEHLERDDRRHRAGRDVAEHLGDGGARRRLHRHTDDFWGRGKHKNVDENTDVQDPSKPRCPNCNELCKSQRGINIHLARSKCKPVSKHIGHKTRRDVVRRKTKEDADELPKVDVQGTDLKCSSDHGHTPPQPQHPRHQHLRTQTKNKIFFYTKNTTVTFESTASHVIFHCLSV